MTGPNKPLPICETESSLQVWTVTENQTLPSFIKRVLSVFWAQLARWIIPPSVGLVYPWKWKARWQQLVTWERTM